MEKGPCKPLLGKFLLDHVELKRVQIEEKIYVHKNIEMVMDKGAP